jgi:nitrogen fixation protein FixH
MSRRVRGERGQASVELVALAPLVVAVVLAVAQVLAAGAARELAGHAAEAGAVALLQGADAGAAARHAVPGWSRGRLRVRVEQRRVRVRLRPRAFVPGLAGLLEATGAADAGPAPR